MSTEWESLMRGTEAARRKVARLRSDLESRGATSRAAPPPNQRPLTASLDMLMDALGAFPTIAGYANSRRPKSGVAVDSEAAVQDLLFYSLKPLFGDLVYEQPTEKGSAGYSIGDFHIPSLKLILEAKYVGAKADVKARADEIAEDIWKYATQTTCERIVFFVYDPGFLIPDRKNFARMSSATAGDFKAKGREVEIVTVVKP